MRKLRYSSSNSPVLNPKSHLSHEKKNITSRFSELRGEVENHTKYIRRVLQFIFWCEGLAAYWTQTGNEELVTLYSMFPSSAISERRQRRHIRTLDDWFNVLPVQLWANSWCLKWDPGTLNNQYSYFRRLSPFFVTHFWLTNRYNCDIIAVIAIQL